MHEPLCSDWHKPAIFKSLERAAWLDEVGSHALFQWPSQVTMRAGKCHGALRTLPQAVLVNSADTRALRRSPASPPKPPLRVVLPPTPPPLTL